MVGSGTLAFFWSDAVHHHVVLTVFFLSEVVGDRSAQFHDRLVGEQVQTTQSRTKPLVFTERVNTHTFRESICL